MLIRAGFDLAFEAYAPTQMVTMLSVRPSRFSDLRTDHRIVNDRGIELIDSHDAYGNICTRFLLQPGMTHLSCDFIIADSGEVDRQTLQAHQHDIHDLPAEALTFLAGSRYCETDLLSGVAWGLFGHVPPGWQRAQAIVDFVHHHLTYGYCHARSTRTAWEAYQERVGVCRDFAHLAVALCRCMNIPARYCSGYLGDIGVDPVDVAMDFHAWFEVYLSGEWHSFDARHRVPRIGRILMACGRDAADTALTTAFGPVCLAGFKVHTDEVASVIERVGEKMAA
ncbi:transglutaminase-like domain-containing protein [Sphingobium cupriresistens]|uniref:Transglutaminase n=1 Tax=Sphingobium cupriresistens LL01 TaxID=1420583 RepID=A0A0J7Y411_9SPHN|nr:transglutaminase family protein [Sphingobium cupriresistens]KMS58153.1 transglutaminase [Sphingobium cupriresistens LL01]